MLALQLAAQDLPQLAYVYPAGMQAGTTVEITFGGRFLQDVTELHCGQPGLHSEILARQRPLNPRERQLAQDRLRQLSEQRKTTPLSSTEEGELRELRTQLAASRRSVSAQLAETVTVRLTAGSNVPLGSWDLRLRSPTSLSNPLRFCIGDLPERNERAALSDGMALELPGVANGRLLDGAADQYRIPVQRGRQYVAQLAARQLLPYLADAVPGWLQGKLVLRDQRGNFLRSVDDNGVDPDPVLQWVAEEDGICRLEVSDALQRSREDFVYRLTVGELPVVRSAFPLGVQAGATTTLQLFGANLPHSRTTLQIPAHLRGVFAWPVPDTRTSLTLVVQDLQPLQERELPEPTGHHLELPACVNGNIHMPGDVDRFSFQATTATTLVAEVFARRLGSPLDPTLRLLSPTHKELARSDDEPDTASGLITHAADSRIVFPVHASGEYQLVVQDATGCGSSEHVYCLRVGPPSPDFAVRLSPSAVALRPGHSEVLRVFIERIDGFAGDLQLVLQGGNGISLAGGHVPGTATQHNLTLTAASDCPPGVLHALRLQATARIGNTERTHAAVPCEDRMQAFAYQHLVPSDEFLCLIRQGRTPAPTNLPVPDRPLAIPWGGTCELSLPTASRALPADARVVLFDAPAGLTLSKLANSRRGPKWQVAAARQPELRNLRGNLILQIVRGDSKPQILFTLPALPFTVVDR